MFTKIIAGTALIAVSAVSAQAIEVSINPNAQQNAANQLGQKLSNRQLAIQHLQEQIKNAPADQKAMLQNRLTALQNTSDQKFQDAIMHVKGNSQQNPANAQQQLKDRVNSEVAQKKAQLAQKLDNSKAGQAYQKYQNAQQQVQQDKQDIQDLKSSTKNLLKGW